MPTAAKVRVVPEIVQMPVVAEVSATVSALVEVATSETVPLPKTLSPGELKVMVCVAFPTITSAAVELDPPYVASPA